MWIGIGLAVLAVAIIGYFVLYSGGGGSGGTGGGGGGGGGYFVLAFPLDQARRMWRRARTASLVRG